MTSDQVRALATNVRDVDDPLNLFRRDTVAALQNYADLLDRTQWQPIDTFVHSDRVESVLIADATGDVCQAWYDKDKRGWWEINSHETDYCPRPVYPTHWRPLPDPPVAASPGTGGA